MRYSALEVSKYILSYCSKSGSPISNLQLQKILYFLQGEYYRRTFEPLFEEDICAWKFGPVVPEVYYEFCVYGGAAIVNQYEYEVDIYDEDKVIINEIVDERKKVPVWKLVQETHENGTPWHKVFTTRGDRAMIPKTLISEYFSQRVD